MQRALVLTILVMLVAGGTFRFVALADKLYTNDEATTSVHVSGHTIADFLAAAAAGRVRTTGDALRFQGVDPGTNAGDVVASLASEDPQHPPLFYLLERAFEQIFGTSLTARRALPALIGVLVLGAAYFLGTVLFRRRTAGLIFAALIAASPFHQLYAQQAREYSLWTLLVLFSSAFLLRALENEAPADWIAYAVCVLLGLYTDTLFLYTLVSYAAFVLLAYRSHLRARFLPFALWSGAALLGFVPWLSVLYRGRAMITNNAYLSAPLPAKLFALKWLFNIGAVFFDLDYVYHKTAILLIPIVLFVAAGCLLLLREAGHRTALFCACLFAQTTLAFVLTDLLRHESRSTSARYLMPAWLACELAVTYVLLALATSASMRARTSGTLALGAFGIAGLGSCWFAMHREYWWGDASVAPIGPIARAVRAAPQPVSIVFNADGPGWDFAPMMLANAVPPGVRLVFVNAASSLQRPSAGTVFVLDPSPNFIGRLAAAGWHPSLTYRFETMDSELRPLRAEAAASRAVAGVAETTASLWRLP